MKPPLVLQRGVHYYSLFVNAAYCSACDGAGKIRGEYEDGAPHDCLFCLGTGIGMDGDAVSALWQREKDYPAALKVQKLIV